MVIWYKFCSSTSFSFLFIYLFFYHDLFLFLCFCTFIWLQGDLRGNWTKVIFYFWLILTYFFVLSIKDNYFFSIIIHYLIPFIFLLLVQSHLFVIISFYFYFYFYFYLFIFFMEHIFYKIILNIYFDYIHIMCLYRVFSVFCTSYILVYIKAEYVVIFLPRDI